jgi:uncharacterized caspase-like protein
VGNNAGAGEQPPLRFAETDAGKMARVLVELGGVVPQDLQLLQGRSLGDLKEALASARARVASYRASPDDRVVLLFYFSGHSDGEALELGKERLPFGELKKWLDDTRADVRLGIVDSCKSGALLAVKGGTPGPAFQIRLSDDLASTGQAIITSSAADELALESNEIRGSFFTHHLVSGLRGAADASGDGRVTLAEAYQYAFGHTVSATAGTIVGPQHPAYDYRLSGQGELVLTELSRPTAALELPAGFERALVVQVMRDQVLAELASGAAPRVAVPPGDYAIRAWKGGLAYAGRFALAEGETRTLRWEELAPVAQAKARPKGSLLPPPGLPADPGAPRGRADLFLAMGGGGGVAAGTGVMTSGRFGVRGPDASDPFIDLAFGTGRGADFRETTVLLFAGYRLGFDLGPARAYAGVELGGGAVLQSVDAGKGGTSGAAAAGPLLGATWQLTNAVGLGIEGHLPLTLLTVDGALSVVPLPAAYLGVVVRL